MKFEIGILNIGVNNIKSLKSFFSKFGRIQLISEKKESSYFKNIDLLIIPGNGSFLSGSVFLQKSGLSDEIKNFKKKIIGICLGMQLLFDSSEENPNCGGLGIIKGTVKKINSSIIKLPLLGWYTTIDKKKEKLNFFFNNSYSCVPTNKSIILRKIDTNEAEMVSMIKHKNIYGVQFHPEKSSINGNNLVEKILNDSI